MSEIRVTTELPASPEQVWEVVGDFGALDAWHPWVPNCTLGEDGITRTIDMGAASAIEVLDPDATTDRSHTYRVEKSPMPVRDYRATWKVEDADDGCTLDIHATFEPVGDEAQALALLQGFFDTAVKALRKRFA